MADEKVDLPGEVISYPWSTGNLDAVQPRHAHIEQHEVRAQRLDRLQRLLATVSRADDLEALRRRDHVIGDPAEHRLVIHDQHPHRACGDGRGRSLLASSSVAH